MFASKYIGAGANVHRVEDAALDKILSQTETEMDPAKRMANYALVQKHVIEQAYIIPLYASKGYIVLNARFKGAKAAPYDPLGFPFFADMYVEFK